MNREELHGLLTLVAFAAFGLGFKLGKKRGASDLLREHLSALRITTKEQ